MGDSVLLWLAGGAVIVTTAVVMIRLFARMRDVDLTSPPPPGEKPPWTATTPPQETLDAIRADGEEGTLWDHDPGERVAAAFAEQIEDIVQARIAADPELADIRFDLGTAPDRSLEFWVNGEPYGSVEALPDERLRQIVREAVAEWERRP